MALNDHDGRNRTAYDSGVKLDGPLFAGSPITGTGVTPVQAAALAAPLAQFLAQIPYDIDANGRLAAKKSSRALQHAAALTFAPGHPKAGQPVMAELLGGDYITKYGGAPMPYLDLDYIPPAALEPLLGILNGMLADIVAAT